MRNQPPRLSLEIVHDVFVTYVEHDAFREDRPPVAHQFRAGAVIAAKLGEVAGIGRVVPRQLRKVRQAGVDRVTAGMDDAGIRQRQVNEADMGEAPVAGHPVAKADFE